jgi:hypothetical protein
VAPDENMIVLRSGASRRHLLPPPVFLLLILLCALPAAMSDADTEFMTGDFDYQQQDLTTASGGFRVFLSLVARHKFAAVGRPGAERRAL